MLNIKTFCFNPLQENTYIVSDDTRECVIIDCGAYYDAEREALVNYIDTNNLNPRHLLATHGHFDHNFGIDTVFAHWGLKTEVSASDEWLITDIPGQFEAMAGIRLEREYPSPDHFFADDEVISFGTHQLQILPTPGHTPGGVTFYCQDEQVAFTGDTLFRMSIGRTDFERGSYEDMKQSLRKLSQLPADTTVYTGHGPATTIGDEMKNNPYF
jgi:glyoxylase-like metal-dependent hydrolase (beta-lactamase superfamily II)